MIGDNPQAGPERRHNLNADGDWSADADWSAGSLPAMSAKRETGNGNVLPVLNAKRETRNENVRPDGSKKNK